MEITGLFDVDSPQKENGYTPIANELMEALTRYRIPGEQMQCLLFILRKTYGFNKKEDMISNSQFVENTGLKKGNVSRAIRSLVDKNIVIKSDNRNIPTYRFNKHYRAWKLLSKKQPVIKSDTAVIKSDNRELSKAMDTKDISTKDTVTKDKGNMCPYEEILDIYHSTLEGLPLIAKLSSGLRKKIKARWMSDVDRRKIEWWRWYFEGVAKCDFLMGRIKDWSANFHWLIGPENMDKVLSGYYTNRSKTDSAIEDWINE